MRMLMPIAQMPFDVLDLVHDARVLRAQIGAPVLQIGEMRAALAVVAFAVLPLVRLERVQLGGEHFEVRLHVEAVLERVVELLQVGDF